MSFAESAGVVYLSNYAVTEQRFWLQTAENVKLYYIRMTEKDGNCNFIGKLRRTINLTYLYPEIISCTWNFQSSAMPQLQTLLCNPWSVNEFEVMY